MCKQAVASTYTMCKQDTASTYTMCKQATPSTYTMCKQGLPLNVTINCYWHISPYCVEVSLFLHCLFLFELHKTAVSQSEGSLSRYVSRAFYFCHHHYQEPYIIQSEATLVTMKLMNTRVFCFSVFFGHQSLSACPSCRGLFTSNKHPLHHFVLLSKAFSACGSGSGPAVYFS